jgi:tetratricopeptide (TPR) repeat protein
LFAIETVLAVGPFDYNNAQHRKDWLGNVEGNHFTKDVEKLKKGITGTVFDDIDYTLRVFPNHHRALNSLARLFRSYPNPPTTRTPASRNIDFYFERAIRFTPSDPIVYLLYGIHFHKLKKWQKAEKQYLMSINLDPQLSDAYYNLGLLYADQNKYDQAYEYGKKAYELGFPLQGLKEKLKTAGTWK